MEKYQKEKEKKEKEVIRYDYSIDEKKLSSLRPNLYLDIENSSPIEQFQNSVIRPIIKMQHLKIMSSVDNSPHFSKLTVVSHNYDLLHDQLTTFVQKNNSLKHQIIGMILGVMTQEELEQYYTQRNELNKRITSISIKRIVDTIHQKVSLD